MNNVFTKIQQRWGLDWITITLLVCALILYGSAWWIRETLIRFNIGVFYLTGGIIAINSLLTVIYSRREPFIGYVFAGTALLVQLLLLILLWEGTRGAVV